MPFIQDQSRLVLVTGVTEEEFRLMQTRIETGDMSLMNGPVAFPSKAGSDYCTMLLEASMGCSSSRWYSDYMPIIEELFPSRIIHTLEFMENI